MAITRRLINITDGKRTMNVFMHITNGGSWLVGKYTERINVEKVRAIRKVMANNGGTIKWDSGLVY